MLMIHRRNNLAYLMIFMGREKEYSKSEASFQTPQTEEEGDIVIYKWKLSQLYLVSRIFKERLVITVRVCIREFVLHIERFIILLVNLYDG